MTHRTSRVRSRIRRSQQIRWGWTLERGYELIPASYTTEQALARWLTICTPDMDNPAQRAAWTPSNYVPPTVQGRVG